jgi:hypothetical protein
MPAATALDHAEAARIAQLTGELLVGLRDELRSRRAHMSVIKNEGDRQAHDLIMSELRQSFPNDAVLSEEGRDRPQRLTAERVWIVDPLDGTREYGEGRSDWAVHIALVIDHQPVAGAVALPALGMTLSTATPPALPLRVDFPGLGGREDDGRRARRSGHLRPLGRAVRMGFVRAGRRCERDRIARLSHRWQSARVQPIGPLST